MNRAAQLLQTCTAFIRSAPVSPVHIRIFSIQDILGLPQPNFPSTRPVIKLPSILSHDCLIMCPKQRKFRSRTCCNSTLLASASLLHTSCILSNCQWQFKDRFGSLHSLLRMCATCVFLVYRPIYTCIWAMRAETRGTHGLCYTGTLVIPARP